MDRDRPVARHGPVWDWDHYNIGLAAAAAADDDDDETYFIAAVLSAVDPVAQSTMPAVHTLRPTTVAASTASSHAVPRLTREYLKQCLDVRLSLPLFRPTTAVTTDTHLAPGLNRARRLVG